MLISVSLIYSSHFLPIFFSTIPSKMADRQHSIPAQSGKANKRPAQDDPLEGPSSAQPKAKCHRGNKPGSSSVVTPSRDEQRHHKAIEKVFTKAQAQTAQPCSTIPAASAQARSPTPSQAAGSVRDLSPDGSVSAESRPLPSSEPLFRTLPTPEASQVSAAKAPAPAPPPMSNIPPVPEAFELMLARAIKQSLAQCLQHGSFTPDPPVLQQHQQPVGAEDSMSEQDLADSLASADQASLSKLDGIPDSALSGDEGLVPDQTPFVGLFKTQLFRSLLHKAIRITRLGMTPSVPAAPVTSDPASAVFVEPKVDPETVPAPKLFLDFLQ